MAYQVKDKTKRQPIKCSYNFACLRNDTWDTCSIESDLPGGFLVVKSNENKSACNYCFPCDDSYIGVIKWRVIIRSQLDNATNKLSNTDNWQGIGYEEKCLFYFDILKCPLERYFHLDIIRHTYVVAGKCR
jgi:hypothetical protein